MNSETQRGGPPRFYPDAALVAQGFRIRPVQLEALREYARSRGASLSTAMRDILDRWARERVEGA
jgi:hypothetical protein